MPVKETVNCTQCSSELVRVAWNYSKNRRMLHFFCDNKCKGSWQTQQRESQGFTKEWLEVQYLTLNKSANQIAREIKKDPKRVWEWMRDYGIEIRPRGTDYGQNIKPGQVSFFKGKCHTEETKKKLSEIAKADKRMPFKKENGPPNKGKFGEESINWRGGLTPERQAFYSSDEWVDAVKKVWARDNATCQKCLKNHNQESVRGKFHIHHITSFQIRKYRAILSNLVLLCNECHRWVHSKKNTNKELLREENERN